MEFGDILAARQIHEMEGCADCDSDDEFPVFHKRVREEARTRVPTMATNGRLSLVDPWPDSDGDEETLPTREVPMAPSPGTPRAPRAAPASPPSTPRGPARAPTTPPPLRRPSPVEPLLLGLQRNCLKQVRLAIEASPEAAKEPFWEPRFEWPLCVAIRLGCSEEIVRLLIESGAKVHVTTIDGQSPLQLLSAGSEKTVFSDPLMNMWETPGEDDWTERLRLSVAEFELAVATALLDAGADPREVHDGSSRGDCSSLELARRSGKDHLVGLYTHGRV